MKTFTIENETNNITLHATVQDAEAVANAERFRNEAGLSKLAANWPTARLIEIWNSLPGVTPVTKFKDRNTAVSRIWKAIQSLDASVSAEVASAAREPLATDLEVAGTTDESEAEARPEEVVDSEQPAPATTIAPQTPDIAPEEATLTKKATRAKKTPKPATNEVGPKVSKTESILALMKQPGGVTLKAIMDATGWQAHSVRGFISGTLGKKMGLTVQSAKGENGERTYSINA